MVEAFIKKKVLVFNENLACTVKQICRGFSRKRLLLQYKMERFLWYFLFVWTLLCNGPHFVHSLNLFLSPGLFIANKLPTSTWSQFTGMQHKKCFPRLQKNLIMFSPFSMEVSLSPASDAGLGCLCQRKQLWGFQGTISAPLSYQRSGMLPEEYSFVNRNNRQVSQSISCIFWKTLWNCIWCHTEQQ